MNLPPTAVVTLQLLLTGEGRSDTFNLVPQGLPEPVNQTTQPITTFTFAEFQQIPIGFNADNPQSAVSIPPGTRYMIMQKTGGGPLNLTWQQGQSDVGIQLSQTGACPLVWALPFTNPPVVTYFSTPGLASSVLYDVLFLG